MTRRLRNDVRAESSRLKNDQRHFQRRLVRKDAVRRLAVLVERLAVVGGQDDERPAVAAFGDHRIEQRGQRRVGRRHIAEIGVVPEPRSKRFGRRVRKMRLVKVNPQEPWRSLRSPRALVGPGPVGIQPLPGRGDRFDAATLGHTKRGVVFALPVAIVVDVEPASEAEAHVERERADEGRGPIPTRFEHCRQRVGVIGKSESGVLADAVMQRVSARENIGVRRQRDDRGGMGAGEPDAACRQPIDPRRRDNPVPVRADRIGS